MRTKIIGATVTILLIVGACAFVFFHAKGTNVHNNDSKDGDISKPRVNLVTQLCQAADYKDSCINTLSKANSTNPKELIKTAIMTAADAVKKSFNFSDDLVVKATNEPRGKMAVDDCKELLDNAVQELQASISLVGDSNLHTMQDRVGELQSWLSSVISYQETCIDGFPDNSTVKPIIQQGFVDASGLTDNVLAVISALSDVLKSFGLQFNVPNSRRLMSMGEDGYPTWMSAGDRKLMGASNGGVRPNAVVSQHGGGQFKTIQAALNAYPKNFKGRYVIYVKAGVYKEYVTVTKQMKNVLIYGDGADKTVITGSRSFAKSGLGTWKTATVIVEGDGFVAKSIAFENTAGPEGHQAVAIRVNSDMSVFYQCRFDGYQDTLLYQAKRQFYKNCVISGTIDFIFGYGAAVIQDSTIVVRMPMDNQQNTLTADGKKERHQKTGLVLQNCRVVAEGKLAPKRMAVPTFLGRPWKNFSTTAFIESDLGDFIRPEGWMPWAGSLFLDTLYYAEYNNRGRSAATNQRVKWKTFHVMSRGQAQQFTAGSFLLGSGSWVRATGTPIYPGLKF